MQCHVCRTMCVCVCGYSWVGFEMPDMWEHISGIKWHLGNQTKKRVNSVRDSFRCHSVLYLVVL